MSIEIKVPMLPESVSDATMLHWHVEAGQAVRRDDNLVDIETEKVVLEVPAPRDGIIIEILRTEGDTVLGDDVIALFEAGAEAVAEAAAASAGRRESGKKRKNLTSGFLVIATKVLYTVRSRALRCAVWAGAPWSLLA